MHGFSSLFIKRHFMYVKIVSQMLPHPLPVKLAYAFVAPVQIAVHPIMNFNIFPAPKNFSVLQGITYTLEQLV